MILLDKEITEELYDITILGGGVAGLAAAITAGQLGLRVLVLEKTVLGGSVAVLEFLAEYPGIEKISGWEFTQNMVKQARDTGCKLIDSIEVTGVVETVDNLFEIKVSDANILSARSVIVCTGGQPLMLEVADEAHFAQHGIHTCAQCAGARYKGKTVAIAGNSSWAVRAAEHLLNLGCTVLYITRDTELSGDGTIINKLINDDHFRFLSDYHITGLYGDEYLEEILVTSLTGGSFQKVQVAAVFVYRGIKPNSSIVPAHKDRRGFLQVDEKFMTSLPGLFASGRVVDHDLPVQSIIDDGNKAAHTAAAWLQAKP